MREEVKAALKTRLLYRLLVLVIGKHGGSQSRSNSYRLIFGTWTFVAHRDVVTLVSSKIVPPRSSRDYWKAEGQHKVNSH